MSTQQAYINGFVKRAAEYGYSRQQAATILKQANVQGVLDSMKKGFGNLKSRVMGGYPEPIGPTQPPDSRGYEQSIGPDRPDASEGYDYPIGPTQPDNFMGAMSGGGSHVPSNKPINMGTNLVGNQPSMSPPAALMRSIADNSSVQAGLQGTKDNWQATRPYSFISGTGNPVMNMLPALVRLPARGALAMAAGGYGAGEDILNKAVNRNPRIAAGLQGYADKAQARVGANLLKGLASIPVGAKGAYNAVQNYNQANPRQ